MPLCRTVPVGHRLAIGPFYVAVVYQEPDGSVGIRTNDGRRLVLKQDHDLKVFPSVMIGLAPTSARGMVRLAVKAPRYLKVQPVPP